MKKNSDKKINAEYILILIISIVFYGFWCFYDGIFITPDAETYIMMDDTREAGYCIYLAFFRYIFSEQNYLMAAVIVQSIIAAIAATILYKEFKTRYRLGIFSSLLILFAQYGITLLNRFIAQRHSGYFNSIETEGLAYSLWVLLFVSLIRLIYDKKKINVFSGALWCIILISIRKQMLISLAVFAVAYILAYAQNKEWIKNVIKAIVVSLVCLLMTGLIECTYNYVLRGQFAMHSGDSSFILGTEIFVADNEMVQYINNPEEKEYFNLVMKAADEKGYNIKYASDNWQDIENRYSESYDNIKFNIINPIIHDELRRQGISEADITQKYNETLSEMMKDLLIPCVPGLAKLYVCNVLHGFVTTILKVNGLLNKVALAEYIVYIIFMMIIAFKDKDNAKMQQTSVFPVGILVAFAIVINILFTSTTIYCQMRYMQYCTALFYQVLIIMFVQIFNINTKQ